MVKKDIKYIDFNGNEQVEPCYFNMTKAEVIDMDMAYPGGLKEAIETATAAEDGKKIVGIFKDLISRSYGVKSTDGKRFIKSADKTSEFMSSEIYSSLFIELIENPDSAAAFVQGLITNQALGIQNT